MIDRETVKQIQQAPMEERFQLIELILQSLKEDMASKPTSEKPEFKRFRVRPFNLGQAVRVDREMIYAERGI